MKLVEDNEKRSEEEQNKIEDEMNGLLFEYESSGSDGTGLQEENLNLLRKRNAKCLYVLIQEKLKTLLQNLIILVFVTMIFLMKIIMLTYVCTFR